MTDPAHSSPRTPRTAAGRALLAASQGGEWDPSRAIAAIEAEAARVALTELRAEVAGITEQGMQHWRELTNDERHGGALVVVAVLALVDRHLREGEAAGGEGEGT